MGLASKSRNRRGCALGSPEQPCPASAGISLIGTAVGPEALAEEPRPDRLTRGSEPGRKAHPKLAEPLSPDPSQMVNHWRTARKDGRKQQAGASVRNRTECMRSPTAPGEETIPGSNAARYREEAMRIRREAGTVHDEAIRQQLLGIAHDYDMLATTTEMLHRRNGGAEVPIRPWRYEP